MLSAYTEQVEEDGFPENLLLWEGGDVTVATDALCCLQ